MSLSGHLEEVPFLELLAVIKRHRRSGVLRLARGVERARIEFRGGEAIRARAPGIPRLGDALVSQKLADPITVREAARIQAEERGRRPLGQILLANGVVAAHKLQEVIDQQVDLAVAELATWASGRFEFLSNEPRPQEPAPLDPSKLIPPSLDPIHFDTADTGATVAQDGGADTRDLGREGETRSRAETRPAGATTAPDPEPAEGTAAAEAGGEAADRELVLEVVSPDDALFELLQEITPKELARPIRVSPQRLADRSSSREHPVFMLLDLRRGELTPDRIAPLKSRRPGAVALAVVDARPDIRRAYEAGAAAVVPPEPEVILAAVENLAGLLPPAPASSLSDSFLFRPAVAAGLGVAQGDASGLGLSATVALELMRAVSESSERAVLFLLGRGILAVAGAFGFGAEGRPLAELTRGLALEQGRAGALAESLRQRRAQPVAFAADDLPEALRKLLGAAPLSGQGIALPVPGQEGMVAVIYADNDQLDREIEDLEMLELAVEQVGPRLETELLIGEASRSLS